MNLLKKICKELGVEVGEEWTGILELHKPPIKCKVENNTLWIYHKYAFEEDDKYNWKEASTEIYTALIKGDLKPTWKPEIGDYFWTVDFLEEDKVYKYIWYDNKTEDRLLKRGLVFKTKEEAMKVANKMIKALKEE